MEYLPLGDISTCYEDPLPETEVKVVGLQLLEGLEKMHKLGITHRDIKPQVSYCSNSILVLYRPKKMTLISCL
jgi:serine/threonine protein kinase